MREGGEEEEEGSGGEGKRKGDRVCCWTVGLIVRCLVWFVVSVCFVICGLDRISVRVLAISVRRNLCKTI